MEANTSSKDNSEEVVQTIPKNEEQKQKPEDKSEDKP